MKKFLIIGVGLILVSLALVWMVVAPQQVERISEPTPVPTKTEEAPKVEPPTVPELLRLVNEERAKVGVSPLTLDERLNQSAQVKADDMTANNYFEHADKNGKHGYELVFEKIPTCKYASENLAISMPEVSSRQTVDNWKLSNAHYQAMIDAKYLITGFGISGRLVVEHFCQV